MHSWDLNKSIWEPVILDPANGSQSGRAIIPVRLSSESSSPSHSQDYWASLLKLKEKEAEDQKQIVMYSYEKGETSGVKKLANEVNGARSEAQPVVVKDEMIEHLASPPPGFESHHASKSLDQGKAIEAVPIRCVKQVGFGEAATRRGHTMRVYPCSKCGARFYTAQNYAAHFSSHYRHETPQARKRRRASKYKAAKLYPVFSRDGKLITMTSNASDCEKLRRGLGHYYSGSAPMSKQMKALYAHLRATCRLQNMN